MKMEYFIIKYRNPYIYICIFVYVLGLNKIYIFYNTDSDNFKKNTDFYIFLLRFH